MVLRLLTVAGTLLFTAVNADFSLIPPLLPYFGPVTAEFLSKPGGLGAFDGPKVKPWSNASSFDWCGHIDAPHV